jgi:hypothetical protein
MSAELTPLETTAVELIASEFLGDIFPDVITIGAIDAVDSRIGAFVPKLLAALRVPPSEAQIEAIAGAIFKADWPNDDWTRFGPNDVVRERYRKLARAAWNYRAIDEDEAYQDGYRTARADQKAEAPVVAPINLRDALVKGFTETIQIGPRDYLEKVIASCWSHALDMSGDQRTRLNKKELVAVKQTVHKILRAIYMIQTGEDPDTVEGSPHFQMQSRRMSACQSDDDGYCEWIGCPQLRDAEPDRSRRHCPLDCMRDDDD